MKQLKGLTKKQTEARADFCKSLDLNPDAYQTNPYVRALMRDCKTYHRLCEMDCNGCTRDKLPFETWQQYDASRVHQQAWIEKRLGILRARIEKQAHELGCIVKLHGDPRGCTVHFAKLGLHKPVGDRDIHSDMELNAHNYPGACVWAW